MKRIKTYLSVLTLGVLLMPATLLAQKESKEKGKEKAKIEKDNDVQLITITRKGEKNNKVVVEITGDKVIINGKSADDYKGGDITVNTRKYKGSAYEKIPRTYAFNYNYDNGAGNSFSEDGNHAMLGVVTDKEDEGAQISEISKGGGAEKAGLKEGDIITKVDDAKIEDPDDLTKVIRDHKPGDKVTVTFLRDKKEQTLTAELTKWKGMKFNSFSGNGDNFNFSMPEPHIDIDAAPRIESDVYGRVWDAYNGRPKLGLSVQDAEDGKGVKVIDVDDESNAYKAGLKEEDVITAINDKDVNSADEVAKIVKENKDKISIKLKVIRDGKPMDIDVKIPRKLKTADL